MIKKSSSKSIDPARWVFEYSFFMLGGAVFAMVWANIDSVSYHNFVEHEIWRGIDLHAIVNDGMMALFFAIAAKEVWEAFLPGGALSSYRKAATPLLATLGGLLGPAGFYILGVFLLGREDDLLRGWAIPCATDLAFSYLVARLIFGTGHPAIAFLLLLAIADDAASLAVVAVAYPQEPIEFHWFGLTLAAVLMGFMMRKLRLQSFWWYLLGPGLMSWISFHEAGIHAALGLIPIIPCMPHAQTDLGIFARKELGRHDTLNEFEHWWKNPVELILGLFALVNAGVVFTSIGHGTTLVLVSLLVGKPVGITLFTWIGEKGLGLEVPAGMNYRHVLTLGMIAGIGFTVSLFVSTAAFPNPEENAVIERVLEEVKMGSLLSFSAAILAFILAMILGVRYGEATETGS